MSTDYNTIGSGPNYYVDTGGTVPGNNINWINASMAHWGVAYNWTVDNASNYTFTSGPYQGRLFSTAFAEGTQFTTAEQAAYNLFPVGQQVVAQFYVFNSQPGTGGTITGVIGPGTGQTVQDQSGISGKDIVTALGFLLAPFTAGATAGTLTGSVNTVVSSATGGSATGINPSVNPGSTVSPQSLFAVGNPLTLLLLIGLAFVFIEERER